MANVNSTARGETKAYSGILSDYVQNQVLLLFLDRIEAAYGNSTLDLEADYIIASLQIDAVTEELTYNCEEVTA